MSVVTDVPGEWLNVAMRAWVDGGGDLRQVLAAVASLIAAQERERCAALMEAGNLTKRPALAVAATQFVGGGQLMPPPPSAR